MKLMRLPFIYDVQEITVNVYRGYISTFVDEDKSEKSDSEFNSEDSDSDFSDFDPDDFKCGDITPEVEKLVEDNWQACDPLEEIYGATASGIIKETVKTAREETQCVGLNFFKDLTPGKDRSLIETCTEVSFWCCCESIKKVSPIIAEATSNLMY